MSVDPKYYVHDDDRAALEALQAIPGFQQLLKTFMKEWSEKYFRIINMSSRVRISDKQLPKYHAMLEEVCAKLGIEVPELYLEMNVVPNSYTSGDTKPFIVITSGLLDALPEELIPTVLAHECGHIACHHVLYRTMGAMILSGTVSALSVLVPLGALISLPLEVAFYNWMRCSEYSADRAAILCDGTADKMIEVCMRLAGLDRSIAAEVCREEFMAQAREYEEMVRESGWNRNMEFMMLRKRSHPFMAVRALECERWTESEQYRKILDGTYSDEEIPERKEAEEEPSGKKSRPLFDLSGIELPKIDLPQVDLGSLFHPKQQNPEEEPVDLTPVYHQLRELKKLMEEGIITPEEYEAKKKRLLDL